MVYTVRSRGRSFWVGCVSITWMLATAAVIIVVLGWAGAAIAGSVKSPALRVVEDGDCLLALVTKQTLLRSDYVPSDLKPVPAYLFPPRALLLRAEALEQLEALWQAAQSDGVILHVLSTYRSYEYQRTLFENYAAQHGEEAANRFSARPGQSEHQLGTAVDFGGTSVDWTEEFARTPQGRWLAEHAHRFGFALSYPEGKEHLTGYIYEPWHYRYIGVENALEWKESELVLSEYLALKNCLIPEENP